MRSKIIKQRVKVDFGTDLPERTGIKDSHTTSIGEFVRDVSRVERGQKNIRFRRGLRAKKRSDEEIQENRRRVMGQDFGEDTKIHK